MAYTKKRMVFGVGVNDADYTVTRYIGGRQVRCIFYRTWLNMLGRCYNPKYKAKYPTYKNCTVCDEWLTFSKFKAWMEQQDWKGNVLDKDLIKNGNKIYSPDFCLFISAQVNGFLLDSAKTRGECMIGVTKRKQKGNYQARCSDPFIGKVVSLGYYEDEISAHKAWAVKKSEIALKLSLLQIDDRVAKALVNRYCQHVT